MKTLLHLMRKDMSAVWSAALFTWGCLFAGLLMTVTDRHFQIPSLVPKLASLVDHLIIPISIMLVLLKLIQSDHPDAADGPLQTRPLSAVMRWLPKFTLWALVIGLPAVLAVSLNLLIEGVAVGWLPLLRITLKNIFLMISLFGGLAFLMTGFKSPRGGIILCLPFVIALQVYQSIPSRPQSLSLFDTEHLDQMNLETSRQIATGCLIGLLGFGLAAWRLSRRPFRVALPSLSGISILALAAYFLWPLDLISRPKTDLPAQEARVRELASKARASVHGLLSLETTKPRSYITDRVALDISNDALEWPVIVKAGHANPIQMADGTSIKGVNRAEHYFVKPTNRRHLSDLSQTRPIPIVPLLELLNLPRSLHEKTYGHAMGKRPEESSLPVRQRLTTATSFPDKAPVTVAGEVLCEWFRPVVLGSIPLEVGAEFAQDGMSVRLLAVSANQHGHLKVHMRLTSIHGWHGMMLSEADQHPHFQLVIVHPETKEIALRDKTFTSDFHQKMNLQTVRIATEYNILSADSKTPKSYAFWTVKARVYIVRRMSLGRAGVPYRNELTLYNTTP